MGGARLVAPCAASHALPSPRPPQVLLADKRTAAGAVNIKTNEERMKVGGGWLDLWVGRGGRGRLGKPGFTSSKHPPPSLARAPRRIRLGVPTRPSPPLPPPPSLEHPQEMRAFWLPGKTPEAKVVLEKPDMGTTCPASGAKLKLKAGVWSAWTAPLCPSRRAL